MSVVVPTYRRPALLREALASALHQDGVAVEVIVTDDDPEGSAREVVASLEDARVVYLRHEPPSGGRPARVRNLGFAHSRGPFIHFLDDDDRVGAGAYRAALDEFSVTDAAVVFGRVEPFGDEASAVCTERAGFAGAARRARTYGRLGWRGLVVTHQFFCPAPLFVNSACLFRREVVTACGGYDPALPVIEDLDFIVRAIREGGFRFVDHTFLHYRITPGSLMSGHRSGSESVRQACELMYRKYRAAHGIGEYLALKLLGRGLLRWL